MNKIVLGTFIVLCRDRFPNGPFMKRIVHRSSSGRLGNGPYIGQLGELTLQ